MNMSIHHLVLVLLGQLVVIDPFDDFLALGVDGLPVQGCQMAKFDPFLSLDCAREEGVGAQSKERKGSNFAA